MREHDTPETAVITPDQAASILGIHRDASAQDVQRRFEWRFSMLDPADTAGRETLTAAKDALLGQPRWQPPAGHPYVPPAPPGPRYAPQYPPSGAPVGAHYPPPPPSPRPGLSTGAIVGWTLGAIAGATVFVVAVAFVIGLAGHLSRVTAAASTAAPSTAAPSIPSPTPTSDTQVFDGVTVESPATGWTFTFTSVRDCPSAKVIVGFSATVDGGEIDQWTGSASLTAGIPYSYTIPDSASTYNFAAIDDVICSAT
jgi:hypothetical protein